MEPARRTIHAAATGVGSATTVDRRVANVTLELATLASARMGHLPCQTLVRSVIEVNRAKQNQRRRT
jgi:hypothetical protein